jgi:hypothetical protein
MIREAQQMVEWDWITLVYWKFSCLPVKVASMDWGAVSI